MRRYPERSFSNFMKNNSLSLKYKNKDIKTTPERPSIESNILLNIINHITKNSFCIITSEFMNITKCHSDALNSTM